MTLGQNASRAEAFRVSRDPLPRAHFLLDLFSVLAAGFAEVVHQLQVHPELGAVAEVFCEAQRRVGRDGPLAVDDLPLIY